MKFKHFRVFNTFGELLPFGGVTVAYENINDNLALICAARCSLRDNFSKKIGRRIAAGRLTLSSDTDNIRYGDVATYEIELNNANFYDELRDIAHEVWNSSDVNNNLPFFLEG